MSLLIRNAFHLRSFLPGVWSPTAAALCSGSSQACTLVKTFQVVPCVRRCRSISHKRLYSSLSPNHHRQADNSSSSSASPPHLPFSSQTLLITEAGKERLQNILSNGSYLRVSVEGGGCSGFQYKFVIVEGTATFEKEDVILEFSPENNEPCVVIDQTSLDILRGSTLDFEKELIRAAFRIIDIPLAEQGCSCGASFNVKID